MGIQIARTRSRVCPTEEGTQPTSVGMVPSYAGSPTWAHAGSTAANVCKANTRALQLMPGGTFAGRTIQQRNAMQAGRVKEKAEENSARNRGHQPAQAQLGRSGKNI